MKQNTNEFVAFRAMFNRRLYQALHEGAVHAVQAILEEEYAEETEGGFYVEVPLDMTEIRACYARMADEVAEDPSLEHKL